MTDWAYYDVFSQNRRGRGIKKTKSTALNILIKERICTLVRVSQSPSIYSLEYNLSWACKGRYLLPYSRERVVPTGRS
jgi:hypothetical protein